MVPTLPLITPDKRVLARGKQVLPLPLLRGIPVLTIDRVWKRDTWQTLRSIALEHSPHMFQVSVDVRHKLLCQHGSTVFAAFAVSNSQL
jgi:hypothetical protein